MQVALQEAQTIGSRDAAPAQEAHRRTSEVLRAPRSREQAVQAHAHEVDEEQLVAAAFVRHEQPVGGLQVAVRQAVAMQAADDARGLADQAPFAARLLWPGPAIQ